jgi:BirA family biotin operon repressor/biotin-[acetyl-CoA-carboxylase] ligase
VSAPADLSPARLATLLRTRSYGRSLEVLEQTDSTNDDARRAALAGAVSGHAVLADRQTAGRGSQGRSWSSPGGLDLYVSIVERPSLSLAELPPLTLAVGLGVAGAVDELLGAVAPMARVKWPNDVWLDGKKCAGVLIEASSQGEQLHSLVIGIGLNLNRQDFAGELADSATSLRAQRPAQPPLDRGVALAVLLAHVEDWVTRFTVEGAAAVASALDARLAMLGETVRCGALEGRLIGVSRAGAALIETASGPCEAFAGRLERRAGH